MHPSAMAFACSALTEEDVTGKRVIEAGSYDVNGSVRPHVEALGPASYVGTDMREGPGVDQVMDAALIPARLGVAEVIICTEMLEHAEDWQEAMRGLIVAIARGGILVLTTRGPGFPVHGYPEDHWRFTPGAMRGILEAAGLLILRLEPDEPGSPGVLAKARKPARWAWPKGVQEAWEQVEVTRP